ncbi:MAG: acyl-CoA dehydrogenase family protein [candidate division WOR-3 bacterium]
MPINLDLDEEHLMLKETVRDFVERYVKPVASDIDEKEEFPFENVRRMGELGFLGIKVSPQYGGAGMDTLAYIILIEELSKVCPSHGVIASVNNSLYAYGLEKFGTEEQKKRFLVPLVSPESAGKSLGNGKINIGAFALTEPHTGSDAVSLKSRAIKRGSKYIINGQKVWITNGPVAKYVIFFAQTDPEKGHNGITAFLIDMERDGAKVGSKEKKLGIRGAWSGEIILEDYEADESEVLGKEGEGFKIAMEILNDGRIGIGAQALGIAEGAYEEAKEFSKTRYTFGKPIYEHEAVGFTLADMWMKIEAARLLLYRAAYLKDSGKEYFWASSMAKLFASETAMWVTTKAIQIMGSMGYSRETNSQRLFRDAKVTEIYEGTSEIQRLILLRRLLKS